MVDWVEDEGLEEEVGLSKAGLRALKTLLFVDCNFFSTVTVGLGFGFFGRGFLPRPPASWNPSLLVEIWERGMEGGTLS